MEEVLRRFLSTCIACAHLPRTLGRVPKVVGISLATVRIVLLNHVHLFNFAYRWFILVQRHLLRPTLTPSPSHSHLKLAFKNSPCSHPLLAAKRRCANRTYAKPLGAPKRSPLLCFLFVSLLFCFSSAGSTPASHFVAQVTKPVRKPHAEGAESEDATVAAAAEPKAGERELLGGSGWADASLVGGVQTERVGSLLIE